MSNPVAEDFALLLKGLKRPDAPKIMALTSIAKDHLQFSREIAEAVEQRIFNASTSDEALSALFVIDSICKNVGGPYLSIFSRSLVSVFMTMFSRSSAAVQTRMRKTLHTWGGTLCHAALYPCCYHLIRWI